MKKLIFFTGLGIILLEAAGLGGYILFQQSAEFLKSLVLIIIIGGFNLIAVIMLLVGLFSK